jgi:hypothetical protein
MAFDPGITCCSASVCALVKTEGEWEKLPHQTEVSFNSAVSVTGIVTSDTGGRQSIACGTVATTGTIGLACHDGDQARFAVNTRYKIRFAKDCAVIWDEGSGSDEYGAPVAVPTGDYWEGTVLITGEPVTMSIASPTTPVVVYPWSLDGVWAHEPATIEPDIT